MLDAFREDDIELNNQVASWSICLHLKLCSCINNDIASERFRHALSCHSELCLWCNDLCRCHKDFPIIKGVHGDRLHLKRLNKCKRMRVDKIIALALVVWQWLLGELDHEVRWVRAERLMTTTFVHQLCRLAEAWKDCLFKALRIDDASLR